MSRIIALAAIIGALYCALCVLFPKPSENTTVRAVIGCVLGAIFAGFWVTLAAALCIGLCHTQIVRFLAYHKLSREEIAAKFGSKK